MVMSWDSALLRKAGFWGYLRWDCTLPNCFYCDNRYSKWISTWLLNCHCPRAYYGLNPVRLIMTAWYHFVCQLCTFIVCFGFLPSTFFLYCTYYHIILTIYVLVCYFNRYYAWSYVILQLNTVQVHSYGEWPYDPTWWARSSYVCYPYGRLVYIHYFCY